MILMVSYYLPFLPRYKKNYREVNNLNAIHVMALGGMKSYLWSQQVLVGRQFKIYIYI
mgnify:FL=1